MTVQHVTDMTTPIGDILRAAGSDGVLIDSGGQARFAIMPLDDQLIDFLLERSPKFAESCQRIRERMHAGEFRSHEEVKRLLARE